MSHPGTSSAVVRDGVRHLTFQLHGERYAVDIMQITEIIEFRALTVVPMMPPHIRGVINLRGRVLPVVDLSERFGSGPTAVGRRTAVVVLDPAGDDGTAGGGFGIMVDAVHKVIRLDPGDLQPAPAFGGEVPGAFVAGMARVEEQFVVVLDLGTLLGHALA